MNCWHDWLWPESLEAIEDAAHVNLPCPEDCGDGGKVRFRGVEIVWDDPSAKRVYGYFKSSELSSDITGVVF